MKTLSRHLVVIATAIAIGLGLYTHDARSAATLLPNGEQCFSANTASSGGSAGLILSFGVISGGSGYVNGSYANVPLTGGSGAGALATVTVVGNTVTTLAITNPGSHYIAGDVLSAAASSIGGSGSGFSVPVGAIQGTGTGMVGSLGTITGGSGGTSGTYANIALTGGLGSGATANVTVSGGAVTAVQIVSPGSQYVVGDVLSANSGSIGGVSGFSVPVASISINNSLAGGRVYFYVPGTTSFKQTWFASDASANHQNANPVPLDSNGCAIIYGTGIYRQVLQDSLGNTVWDQLTTDTSANNNYFWAGVAGGTPNAITVVDPSFNFTDGSIIGFVANATNTGSTTLLPSGAVSPIPVNKDTTLGPVSLVGGEIVQNNTVEVVYRTIDQTFHLLNPPLGSQAIPSGTESFFAGVTAPSGWYFEYGQAISRTTDVALFTSLTTSAIGNTSSNTTLSGLPNLQGLGLEGAYVEGSGISVGTTVVSVGTSTITISANATATASNVTFRFLPYGQGDGSTTFNLPDRRGRFIAGRDNMGGTAANRLTNPTSGAQGINGVGLSATGGQQSHTQTTAELVGHTHGVSAVTASVTNGSVSITDSRTWATASQVWTGSSVVYALTGASPGPAGLSTVSVTPSGSISGALAATGVTIGGNTDSIGSGSAFNVVPPGGISNVIIKR